MTSAELKTYEENTAAIARTFIKAALHLAETDSFDHLPTLGWLLDDESYAFFIYHPSTGQPHGTAARGTRPDGTTTPGFVTTTEYNGFMEKAVTPIPGLEPESEITLEELDTALTQFVRSILPNQTAQTEAT